jgi:hypothetical protein
MRLKSIGVRDVWAQDSSGGDRFNYRLVRGEHLYGPTIYRSQATSVIQSAIHDDPRRWSNLGKVTVKENEYPTASGAATCSAFATPAAQLPISRLATCPTGTTLISGVAAACSA